MFALDDAYDAYFESVCDYEIPMSRKQFERTMQEWNNRTDRVAPELYGVQRSTNYTAEA